MDDFTINFNIYGDKTFQQWYEEAFAEETEGRHKQLTEEEVSTIQDMVHENTKRITNWAVKNVSRFPKRKRQSRHW